MLFPFVVVPFDRHWMLCKLILIASILRRILALCVWWKIGFVDDDSGLPNAAR